LRDNILHVGLVLSFLLILMVSLLVSSFISSTVYMEEKNLAFLFNAGISLITYTIVFSLLFHYLPHRKVPTSLSIKGALGTAVLFLVGKELIGLYLGHSGLSSAYGAAGSLVVFSLWIYYSSMIIFLGAEIIAMKFKRRTDPYAF
jgi:membrane protein